MKLLPTLIALALLFLAAELANAQSLRQTTVQLPTFEVFGTSTTVIVPDRGTAYLGGVNRSSYGRSGYGVPFGGPGLGNRGIGRASSGGSLSISATIIDHDAMDRAVLAEAARRRGAKFDVLGRPVVAPRAGSRANRNSLRQPRAARASSGGIAADPRLATTYMSRGKRAEASGQPNTAKVFYRRVLKHGTAKLREQAQERLAYLDSLSSAPKPKPAS